MSTRNLVTLLLSLIGLGLSAYLTYVHYDLDVLICRGGGCETVQASKYSEMFGIPVAVFGLLMFLTVIALVLWRHFKPEDAYLPDTGILMLLLASALYFAYLTYLEANVIHAWCQWCVITSITVLIALLWEAWHTWKGYQT